MALTKIKSEGIKDGEVKNADMADDAVGVAELSATGTASSSTFLRGDNSWATPTDTNTVTTINNNADNRLITGSGTANTLEAESSITYDGTKILNISSSAGGFFQGTDTDGGVGLVEMGNGNVALQADTGNAVAGSKIQFYVDNTQKAVIDADGLKFNSDTAAANALDDYETGTFTPDWNGSNAGTTTYSTNQGSYTKIGNIVHVRMYSGINGTSGSGSWRVTNLPFSSPSGLTYITTGSCMTDGLDFDSNYTWVVPYKNSNSTYLDIYASADNGGWDHISVSDDSSFAIILGITYVAA